MSKEFRNHLISAYPEGSWPVMARGVREAVRIADDVRRSTPFLSTLVGGDLRGMLRRAAVMWRFQALCKSGELPFQATEVQVENAPVHLLSILSGKTELHIVRTDEPEGFPVDAQVRQDRRASNTADLFEDGGKIVPLHKALEAVPSLYGWLTWGSTPKGDVTHICLGMPEHDDNTWLAHIDILKHVTTKERGKAEITKTSAPNPALMLKFREEIAHSLEQQANGELGAAE
jgi:hypothetical protein